MKSSHHKQVSRPEKTKQLLITQMERVLELLQEGEVTYFSKELAEIERKLHEIRRDSLRYMTEVRKYWGGEENE